MMLKKRFALLQFAIAGLCLTAGQTIAQTLALPDRLIAFNSPQGEALLIESAARQDFWNLSSQFVTQVNQAYCGVASMVMILNSLGIPAPIAPQYEPYRVFTQDNFFDSEAARQVIAPEVVQRQGLTLEELGKLLESYSVQAKVHHAGDTSLEEFRRLAIENLNQPQNYILINYLRREIGQERGGHISPIAAYHAETDRFLILDVARYKYPPVWVRADELWRSMDTLDTTSGKTRGFVLVSRGLVGRE
ncbi:phytochelatin synthase family protein [Leptolyngbya sp. FACHB-711]|uniref:phytochelatin synthase family protein n=1 Tax=unclassified Leptolyngbya TaxID=2650499 RepID=UPI001686DE35|nr:phytochelatin synthase family protein [Leptolyngbya sp. FACHB-711]MBD1852103.1 phytochelatin synthase family protein [Cyanobacteria bacterium FACHB-502]MBD2024180.1 phytochelatin synthase family protein [Leptolyngbya sp. FACHB-711]